MTTIVIILVVVFLIYAINKSNEDEKSGVNQIIYPTILPDNSTPTPPILKLPATRIGKYLAGHPQINNVIENAGYVNREDDIIIVTFNSSSSYDNRYSGNENTSLKKSGIKNILVEDASTMEKRVTLGRVLLVGIFALAWKKKKINQVAFVTIEYNDGKFDHDIIFQFDGDGAMTLANTARNTLIKDVS